MKKFVDSSVFVYAYLKPRRKLTEKEKRIKTLAREIVCSLESGELDAIITVVHLSEILNILEDRLGLQVSLNFLELVLASENIEVIPVDFNDYQVALEIAKRYAVSANDALAYIKMHKKKIEEIFTFDEHFRNFREIKVLPEQHEYK